MATPIAVLVYHQDKVLGVFSSVAEADDAIDAAVGDAEVPGLRYWKMYLGKFNEPGVRLLQSLVEVL